MVKKSLHTPDRFTDPLGDHMRALKETQGRRINAYPPVREVYDSRYVEFVPNGKVGEQFLGSSDGVVGTILALKTTDKKLGFFSYDGRCVAEFEDNSLAAALKKGWITRCFLAYSTFNATEKVFRGVAACFCYDPELGEETTEALEVFIKNIIDRIAHRSYLKLALDQEQFIKIITSKGQWFLIQEESWPKLPKGVVYYRRRRTLTDRLIDTANKGNKGCLVASWIVLFVLLAGIGLLIWFFFFR